MIFSCLQKRMATALILIPPVVWGILTFPTGGVAILFGTVAILAAWEWARLIGITQIGYTVLMASILGVLWYLLPNPLIVKGFILSAGLGLIGAWIIVWRYPALPEWWHDRWILSLIGLWLLIPAWISLVAIHHFEGGVGGPRYVIFLLALIWVADSAAFFSGRNWGQRRLAPQVSPSKTWEGLWGALVSTLGMGLLGGYWLELGSGQGWVALTLLCLIVVLALILGDLFESVIKRTQGVKDSGVLLPGHGGVLDRIDSLTAAAPVFAFGILLI